MGQVSKKRQGYSLLESLSAMAIFSIAALGWLSVEGLLMQNSSEMQLNSQGAFIAQSKVEMLRQIPFTDLVSSDENEAYSVEGSLVDPSADDAVYTVSWTVTDRTEFTREAKEVMVTVDWDFNQEIDSYVQLIFVRSE